MAAGMGCWGRVAPAGSFEPGRMWTDIDDVNSSSALVRVFNGVGLYVVCALYRFCDGKDGKHREREID